MVRWNTQRKVEAQGRGDGRLPTPEKREKGPLPEISPQAVAQRAYEKFLARGGKHGNDQRDWFEAERELKAEKRSN